VYGSLHHVLHPEGIDGLSLPGALERPPPSSDPGGEAARSGGGGGGGGLGLDARLRMAADCTRAVEYLHSVGLVHSDLRTMNFLVKVKCCLIDRLVTCRITPI